MHRSPWHIVRDLAVLEAAGIMLAEMIRKINKRQAAELFWMRRYNNYMDLDPATVEISTP